MVAGFLYLQYGRDVKVISTMNTASGNFYEMDLTVAANRLFIMDQEKFAEELIDRCIANDFHEVEFSYDVMGYPNRLWVKVYWDIQIGCGSRCISMRPVIDILQFTMM